MFHLRCNRAVDDIKARGLVVSDKNIVFIFPCISLVEPQISHFANFEQIGNLFMVNFDNFRGLKSVLKLHIFILLTCVESSSS